MNTEPDPWWRDDAWKGLDIGPEYWIENLPDAADLAEILQDRDREART